MLPESLRHFSKLPEPQQWEFLLHYLHDTLALRPEEWKGRLKTFNQWARHLQKTDWCLNPTVQKSSPLIEIWKRIRTEMLAKFPDLKELNTLQMDEEESSHPPLPWIVWAHNMRSAHNFGSLIRTVDCMGWLEVWASGYTPSTEHKGVKEAAMGAESWVTVKRFEHYQNAINLIVENKQTLIALERHPQSIPLSDFKFSTTGGVLLLGNEELGVSSELLEKCSQVIEIPQFGRKASLNVTNSFSMVAWESRRSRP